MRALLLFLIFWIFSSSAVAQWTRTNGPEGIGISCLVSVDGTIYAGTEVNGLYASTDDGLNWIPLNSGIETQEVTSVVRKPGYLFVGTFGSGVYRSTDNGLTWLAPSNGGNFAITAIVVKDSFLFAGSIEEGVYRSSDNGQTWVEKLPAFGMGPMCLSGSTIFASLSNYTYRSTDNGETWSNVSALEGASIFSYYCQDSLIIAGGRNKIYKSTDYGNSFLSIDLGFPFGIVNIYSIAAIGSSLFMATSYDGVYKSEDGGLTWSAANTGMGPKDARALAVSESSTLIAGTHYVGVYRSTDLGSSWNKSMAGFLAGSNILSMLVDGSSVFAGTRDGVYRTVDNGNNWVKLAETNDTTSYSDVWAMCKSEETVYASMQLYFDVALYKSTDNGTNWIRCKGAGLPPNLSFMKGLVSSGGNIVAGTDEGIYYSVNGGDNWLQTNILNINVPSLAASGAFVYAALTSGIYRSTDNGVNWSVVLPSTVDYIEVAALDNYAFAGSFFEGARYSTNFGSNWFASGGFPPGTSIFALQPIGDGVVLAGTDLGPKWVYASFNNGASFSPYSQGLGERASVETFAVNDSFMFAGTDQNGVWRRLRPGIVSVEAPADIPHTFYLCQNFPNPFNPSTTIRLRLSRDERINLTIFNLTGEVVRVLADGFQSAGEKSVVWNGIDNFGNIVGSGVYIYRLKVGKEVQSKKMIFVK
jgi:photosystem II stability/assembly factor-like uncharacterized protein